MIQVWAAIDEGEVFYTSAGGYEARVEKLYCGCGLGNLRSDAAANNLDSLRSCHWSAA